MRFSLLFSLLLLSVSLYGQTTFPIKGRTIDAKTRMPIAYAVVAIEGQTDKAAVTDSLGMFTIINVRPGIYSLSASSMGYATALTPQYQISEASTAIEIEMQEGTYELDNIVIKPSPFPRVTESPVSMRRIGLQEIEKSPGANRDVSRIVQSYPGVAFSPAGYRNDLIVRGGSPSENKFFLDGIEIPNINHFSTQGASGGPVSIVNADLIREIDFYTSAFPVDKADALSSMLDIRLKDGNPDKQRYKFTVGASEVGMSGSGHIGKKTTYLVSVRQSYLQLLFKMIGLPFLPNFIDTQVKVKHRFSDKDEITFIGVAGFDKMKLNEDGTTETSEYILSYLPKIEQETFTVGAIYRHFGDGFTNSLSVSHSYLNNRNTKYLDNEESLSENLTLRSRSTEQKTTIRNETRHFLNKWTLRYGVEANYTPFAMSSYQKLYNGNQQRELSYNTSLGMWGWGVFVSGGYISQNQRLAASVGTRIDGNSFSSETARMWKQFSPRATISYKLKKGFSINGSAGLYYQMPPFTALGYRDALGTAVNSSLGYMSVLNTAVGADWRLRDRLFISLEGFYKKYGDVPLSVWDGIPLSDKGDDYGIVGNEPLIQSASGRSYGAELMARWQIPGKVSFVSSLTLFASEYRNSKSSPYEPSAWDNRFILNTSGTYFMGKGWSAGAKLSAIGGAPYSPYDITKSSLVGAWDAIGRPYYDYSLYNTMRLGGYAQLDLRVDKMFYFKRWMLGVYIDLQNVTKSSFKQQDIIMSTGVIENPQDPADMQRYVMKYIPNISGTLLPTIGITMEF